MYQIYWIKYQKHQNPFKEGYIGISNNVKSRFRYHSNKKCSDNPILFRAIQKGAEIVVLETVKTKEQALLREIVYRPHSKIGWNIIPGGVSPPSQKGRSYPSHMKNKKHLDSTKKLMSEQRKGTKWWTNGEKNIRSRECPQGFKLGRTVNYEYKLSEEGKKNIGRSGMSINTPHGLFQSISSACKQLNVKRNFINHRIKSNKFKDWFKTS